MVSLTPASLYLGLTVIQDSPKAAREPELKLKHRLWDIVGIVLMSCIS